MKSSVVEFTETESLGPLPGNSKLAANRIVETEVRVRTNRIWRTDMPKNLFSFLFKKGAQVEDVLAEIDATA